MKNLHENAILRKLIALTQAKEVLPTPDEQEEVDRLERRRVTSEADRQKNRQLREAEKRRQAMLMGARDVQA